MGFEGGGGRFGGGGGGAAGPTFGAISGALTSLLDDFEGADMTPTTQAAAALNQNLSDLDTILARWNGVKGLQMLQFDTWLGNTKQKINTP
jgi:hypothetical protein